MLRCGQICQKKIILLSVHLSPRNPANTVRKTSCQIVEVLYHIISPSSSVVRKIKILFAAQITDYVCLLIIVLAFCDNLVYNS